MENYKYTDFPNDFHDIDKSHLHRVRRESDTTYIDEFAMKELNIINPELCNQIFPGWSRSYYTTAYHMKGIEQYATPNIPISVLDIPVYTECIRRIRTELNSLQPVRAFDVLSELDKVPYKSSSAAGYDYEGAKGELYGYNHMRAIRRARAIIGSVVDQGAIGMTHAITTAVPDVGYTRTQLSDLFEKAKVRGVWGRAFHFIIIEGTSAVPLIDLFSRSKTFYHIGQDPIQSVPQVLSETAAKSKWIYGLDWKQFDATVSRFEIHAAFDILKDLVIFPNKETELAFDISKQLFIHKKIAAPNGRTYWSHKGIPSGSFFTSIIGSVVNRLRIEYIWRKLVGHGPKICFTQGDDSLVGDDELINPKDMAYLANSIGWYFNPEKTQYSRIPEEVTFLGRSYIGGINARDIKKCLRLLVYPEFPVESGDISAYRARSIAQDSGGLSEILNDVATKLRRHYGIAAESVVPDHFKRYIM